MSWRDVIMHFTTLNGWQELVTFIVWRQLRDELVEWSGEKFDLVIRLENECVGDDLGMCDDEWWKNESVMVI